MEIQQRSLLPDPSEWHEMEPSQQTTGAERKARAPYTSRASGRRQRGGFWLTWWKLEIFTCFISTVCMLAIVAILLSFENRPLSSWPYASFSLNSVIAVFATVARSSLMFSVMACIGQRKWSWFSHRSYRRQRGRVGNPRQDAPERLFRDFQAFDDSSRGLLGSLRFFGKIGLRDLAFIGAAITILSLLFNTLTQNLVITAFRMEARTGNPHSNLAEAITRSTNYSNWNQGYDQYNPVPDISTLGAMYEGALSSKISDLPVSCPTGNCTWPTVPSIGVCGECIDVTSSMRKSCPRNSTTCSWSVPGGASLSVPPGLDYVNSGWVPVLEVNQGGGSIWNRSSSAANASGQSILDINIIGLSEQSWTRSSLPYIRNFTGIRAHECALWFCLQAHRTNVSFGVASQHVSAHWNEAHQVESSIAAPDYLFVNVPDNFNVESEAKYVVNGYSLLAINAAGFPDMIYGSIVLNTLQNAGPATFKTVPDGVRSLWHSADNLDGWISNLAKSLSNNVRLTGTVKENNSTKYDGTAWAEEAYIRVQWPWIIFPWALVLLSIGFLFITILENGKSKPWKNSPTAMLYTRLDDNMQEDVSQSQEQNRPLSENINRRTVRLHANDWTFRPTRATISELALLSLSNSGRTEPM